MPWDELRIAGIDLKQNLVQGAVIPAHMRVIQMQMFLGGSSTNAAAVGDQIAAVEIRPSVPGDNDSSFTLSLVPTAEKLLQAIDDNDAAATSSTLQQLSSGLGALHKERAHRSLAALSGTQTGLLLELQGQLSHSLHMNAVAKSVVLANELQSMLDGMLSRHEYVGTYAFNVYEINDALGRAAFLRGDYTAAASYLQKAAEIPPGSLGTVYIDFLGPNLWLAKQLLGVGRREVVLKFLQTCRERFWIHEGMGKLDPWIEALESGKSPDLLPNASVGWGYSDN